ncbi:kinase-like protein [Athelia psychrophila]|uniref:Kinase-like protein n=1 Tax=Athelia psychrophila TaxID=1759441 RepID=A0A165ZW21_9AGAM|nr:kinase-like protein [Fibularhizoctonia sp. CBS 109695]
MPDHHQIVVIKLEYAAPNPAAFDIANHFHQWTTDYHGAAPQILDPARYPSSKERRNFYQAYMAQSTIPPQTLSKEVLEKELEKMDGLVRAWSPASQDMWALWGIVEARDSLEGGEGEIESDYIGYSKCRIEGFRREVKALGIL